MSNAEILAQVAKDINVARSRRALFGHFSMEGKNLTREIEYLERRRRDLTVLVALESK